MKDNTPIPKRLKEARQACGISQKQLGISAGIDEFSASARMNQYETGKHIPDYSTVSRIAKVLKVPAAYFYADDKELARMIEFYGQLEKTKRNKLLNAIRVLENNQ